MKDYIENIVVPLGADGDGIAVDDEAVGDDNGDENRDSAPSGAGREC